MQGFTVLRNKILQVLSLCHPPASAPTSLPLAYSTLLLILLVDIFLLLQVVSSLRATALSWPSLDLQILVENSTNTC